MGSTLVQTYAVFITAKIISLSFVNDFHIFTAIHLSPQRFITNQQNDQLPVGLLAQLVEHCTCIAEVLGLTPIQV